MADERLCLCLNLKGGQPSQWGNYNFNSMARIGDRYVGATDEGLFILDTGGHDNGSPIEAFFELVKSDWGASEQKRIRASYVGFEADGDLLYTVTNDDGEPRSTVITPNHTNNRQHGARVPGAREDKGRYWTARIDNLNGSDFSIDDIKILPVIVNRRPSLS